MLFIYIMRPVLLGGSSRWAGFGSAIRNLGLHSHFQIWGMVGSLLGCLSGALMIFGLFFRPGVLLVMTITLLHVIGALDGGTLRGNLAAVELALILLGLLFVGPGKYSVDKN